MKKTTNLLNLDKLSEEERQNPLFQSYILSFISSLIADYDNDNTFYFSIVESTKRYGNWKRFYYSYYFSDLFRKVWF